MSGMTADNIQRTCRDTELELKQDLKWIKRKLVSCADNKLCGPKRDRNAPRSARQLEPSLIKRSLHHFAVQHVRKPVMAMFREKNASWEKLHQVMNDAGLCLRDFPKADRA
ncbi:hypothetical protein LAD64_24215 [Klebsiella pneumoniae]|nr:hypothetical protein [Klebsiella pneumoniae]